MDVVKKIRSRNQNSLKSAVFELENRLSDIISDSFPSSWDSDNINREIVSSLCELFNDKKIHAPGNSIKSRWKPYISIGKPEKEFGSIAILFNITYHDGHETEGITFYQSHTKDPDKNTFSSLRKDNLKRMNSNSPHSQLLLYDYDSITGMAFATSPEYVVGNSPHSWGNWLPGTHAATAPSDLSLSLGLKTTGLYKITLPFAYQLCYRNFFGLDLDHQKSVLDIGRGLKTDKGNPAYLITVSLAHGNSEPDTDFDIDRTVYTEL